MQNENERNIEAEICDHMAANEFEMHYDQLLHLNGKRQKFSPRKKSDINAWYCGIDQVLENGEVYVELEYGEENSPNFFLYRSH